MRQAMIFAAGLGTRLRPLTATRPKALVEVEGRPLLWHVIDRLRREGFSRLVVNVHHFAPQIVDYLRQNNNFGLDIAVSDESDRLLDTGGGIRKALPLFSPTHPVLIHNVDILSNAPLADIYDTQQGDATLVVSQRDTTRYLLAGNSDGSNTTTNCLPLCGWQNIATGEVKSPYPALEASQCRRLAFSGIHVIAPSLFDTLQQWPSQWATPPSVASKKWATPPSVASDRFSIIDFYLSLCASRDIRLLPCPTLRLLDIGKPETLARAADFLAALNITN